MNKQEEYIRIPWMGLDKWMKNNVPDFNKPVMQEYVKRKAILDAVSSIFLTAAGIIAGMILEYKLLFG